MKIGVTGASSGIGAAIARRFAKGNDTLALMARRKDKLEELREELGKNISTYELDVTSRREVEAVFQKIGPLDVLVNNAGGVLGLDRAQDSDLDEWEKTILVNINGVIYCTHAALPGMVQRNQGHIINIGSIAGSYPYAGGNAYCASKAFVHQFSLALRADLLGTKVRVSCIEPGLLGGTEFSKVRFRGDEAKAKSIYENTEPLQPEDIAEIVYFTAQLPPHVNINTLEVMPVCQAPGGPSVHVKRP